MGNKKNNKYENQTKFIGAKKNKKFQSKDEFLLVLIRLASDFWMKILQIGFGFPPPIAQTYSKRGYDS